MLGLEYPISIRDTIVQRGAAVIRKLKSVVYTAITITMTVAIYQVLLLV